MSRLSRFRQRIQEVSARTGVLAVALSGALLSAAPLLAQEHEGGAGGAGGAGGGILFRINPGLIVWTWVIFLLLLFVLRKWAWGPILGALEAREKRIQDALDEAARDRQESDKLLAEHRKLLDDSRDQAQHILAEGRRAGERLRAELLEEARAQKEQIVERAREDIVRERDQALETLRREAVDLSISAAGRVLRRELDSAENRRLVEEYLDSVAREATGGASDGGGGRGGGGGGG